MSAEGKEARLLLELVGDARAPVELPRQGVMTIGSARDKADLHVDGQGVADVHCAIGRIKGGGWALKDLGSAYGTIVNGEKIQSRRLEAGDLVLLGSRRLRVVDPETAARATAAAAPAPAPSAKPAAAPEPAPAPKLGETGVNPRVPQVKGYRVERLLGRGGMGEVYLAVQESLGRPVALKVLASKLAADADFVKRFQAEARAAAALNHPNVVTVHDVWEESGRHFLAMEYMDRGNLEQRVAREGKLPEKEALEVLHDASKALVYAELRGIVHRDIKPANLMQNQVGTTKLADLGLAMHLEAEATESDNKKIYGTPHFISPEQARGDKVDVRSDMYSLGATMYRLLSGRTPFEGATTRDILRGHFLEEPKPLVELVQGLSPELAALVHRLLKKKPDERFPSSGVLLQELERLRSASLHGALATANKPKSGAWVGLALGAAAVAAAVWIFGGGKNAGPTDPRDTNRTGEHASVPPPVDVDERTERTSGDRPRDDDQALKQRELEAENALLKLHAQGLEPALLADELSALAQRFGGTTAAGKANEEADQIRGELARTQAATSQRDAAKSDWLARLRADASDSGQPKALADALRTMLNESVPTELAEDQAVIDQRKAIFNEVVHDALKRARQKIGAAEELERDGKFDEVETLLRPLLRELDLPQMPPDLSAAQIPALVDVAPVRGSIELRLDGLTAARAQYVQALSSGDLLKVSQFLRGSDGFEGALRSLDLRAMEERLAALEAQLSTDESRRYVQDLRAGLVKARGALDTIVAEFERGGWRRKTFSDPRAKGRTREALGATAEGLVAKTDGGSELVKWSNFGGRTSELHQVFFQRLGREYTRDELAGINVLLRLTAVLQTVDETSELLQPNSTSVLSQEESRTIFDGYDLARTWSAALGDTAALDRELEAAHTLTSTLQAAHEGAWSRTVAGLERLLGEFSDTLLVRLLSDGHSLPLAQGR